MKNTPPNLRFFHRHLTLSEREHRLHPPSDVVAPQHKHSEIVDKWLNSWPSCKPLSISQSFHGWDDKVGYRTAYVVLFEREDFAQALELYPVENILSDSTELVPDIMDLPLSKSLVYDFFKLKQSSKQDIADALVLVQEDDDPSLPYLERDKLWLERARRKSLVTELEKRVVRHLNEQENEM